MSITIGERLKQLVKERKKEQQEVAWEIGMKSPTFNGYVCDNREPPVEKLKLLASYFNVSIDYLVGYSEIRNPYLPHLSVEEREFVNDPDKKVYIELAMNIVEKTLQYKKTI